MPLELQIALIITIAALDLGDIRCATTITHDRFFTISSVGTDGFMIIQNANLQGLQAFPIG